MQTLKDLGCILALLVVAGYAVVQGYLGLTGDRVPIVPARTMRESSGVFVYWSEQPIWSAVAVTCWFVFAALMVALALWWGFSDNRHRTKS